MSETAGKHELHVSGELLATTPQAIASALVPLFPTARIEVWTELALEHDSVSMAIYPDGRAPEGGHDFLISGVVMLERDEARAVVLRIGSALAQANIAHVLESQQWGKGAQTTRLESDSYRRVLDARSYPA